MAKTRVAPDPNVGQNIQLLMEADPVLSSQPALAKRTGVAQSTIGRIIRGEVNPSADNLRKIAESFNVRVDMLYQPPQSFSRALRDPQQAGVAHSMSQAKQTLSLPRHNWEELMTADLNRPFELVVMDDALSPEIYSGCIARFDKTLTPRAGRPVLVRDAQGNHYLRDYQVGPGGAWQATARARGYATLDSDRDGLQLVAVMKGVDWP